jgi:hypothetical protein
VALAQTTVAASRYLSAAQAAQARAADPQPRSGEFARLASAMRTGGLTSAAVTSGKLATARNIPQCQERIIARYNGAEETYMGLYAWSGAPATITESVGADHTLQVGLKADNGRVSGSGSVTVSVSGSNGQTVTGIVDAWAVGTVHYVEKKAVGSFGCSFASRLVPSGIGDPIKDFRHAYHSRLTRSCIQLYANSSEWWKDSSRNQTVAAGVDIPGIGWSASAQSGYTRQSKLAFKPKKNTQLCGNGRSVRESSVVEAHKA